MTTLRLPTVQEVLNSIDPVPDAFIPVLTGSIDYSIRREMRARTDLQTWTEVYQPSGGCRYGCKLYAKRQGAVVRFAVLHSSTYGHGRRRAYDLVGTARTRYAHLDVLIKSALQKLDMREARSLQEVQDKLLERNTGHKPA